MTEVRLYGRMIDRARIDVGVAMDNLTDEVVFLFAPAENPYIADEESTRCVKDYHRKLVTKSLKHQSV